MKTQRNIFIAFLLNLLFSVFEFFGGIFTGSVAILADAIHDLGDAASIGISYYLEKKSKQQSDAHYTYGYTRYSVLGGFITTVILLVGSVTMIYHAVLRLLQPAPVDYSGMILFAVVGVVVNFCAAYFTREGSSINQKAVNLHMLEDVLGWLVVLLGAVIMHFTDLSIIDPIMSIGVSCFILFHAVGNLQKITVLFLEKAPNDLDPAEIKEHLMQIDGVLDVHHIHLRSLDGQTHCATMHIVTDSNPHHIKHAVRKELLEHGIGHATLELETSDEHCHEVHCQIKSQMQTCHGHHHHIH